MFLLPLLMCFRRYGNLKFSYTYNEKINHSTIVLHRSPECWGYIKISGYCGKEI